MKLTFVPYRLISPDMSPTVIPEAITPVISPITTRPAKIQNNIKN